jgi:hypothetical protein
MTMTKWRKWWWRWRRRRRTKEDNNDDDDEHDDDLAIQPDGNENSDMAIADSDL